MMIEIDNPATNAWRTGREMKLTTHPSRSSPAVTSSTPDANARADVTTTGSASEDRPATIDADKAATAEAGPTTRIEVPPVTAYAKVAARAAYRPTCAGTPATPA